MVPAIRDPEALASLAAEAAERGIRGWLLTSEHDPSRPQVEQFHTEVTKRGLACELVVEPGLGHDFPEDFGGKLAAALKFILR